MHLQKEEIAALALLLCAAVATSAFAFLATSGSAPYTASSKAGDNVHLEGLLLYKEKTKTGGNWLLTVQSDGEPVTVFVPSSSGAYSSAESAAPGRLVDVQGKVQDYKGTKEVAATAIELK